jgi:ribosomal protein S21
LTSAFSTTSRQLRDSPKDSSPSKTKTPAKPSPDAHPLSHLADSNISTNDLVQSAFQAWKAQHAQKTSQQISDALATPPRKVAPQQPNAFSSVTDTEKDELYSTMFPDPTSGGFDNPFMSQRPKENALERWKAGVEAMDESLHLGLKTGRQMEVVASNATDLAIKLGMLGALTSRNKVRQDERRQKFHERPGLKRKRLKRERWRKRFSTSFASICARATSLARQGW